MNTLDILIVEDDFSFALELEILVKKTGYQLAGVVDNAKDALDHIYNKKVDLILMDIEIKGDMTGLEIGHQIQHLDIPILYITSFNDDKNYEKAQKSKMIGFLVKPINKLTLLSTIDLAISSLVSQNQTKGFLFFKRRKIYHKINKNDILFIEADGDFINVHTRQNDIFFARMTFSKIESILPSNLFIKTHRSYIVQIKAIEQIDFNEYKLIINGIEIPISRSRRKQLEASIDKMD